MAKYHIKPDGTPDVCKAKKGRCRYGSELEHFNSFNEAQQYSDDCNEMNVILAKQKRAYLEYSSLKDGLYGFNKISTKELDNNKILNDKLYVIRNRENIEQIINDYMDNLRENHPEVIKEFENDYGLDFREYSNFKKALTQVIYSVPTKSLRGLNLIETERGMHEYFPDINKRLKTTICELEEKSNTDSENELAWSRIKNNHIITRSLLKKEFSVNDKILDDYGIENNVEYNLLTDNYIERTVDGFLENNEYSFHSKLSERFGDDFERKSLLLDTFTENVKKNVPKAEFRGNAIFHKNLTQEQADEIYENTKSEYIDKFSTVIQEGGYFGDDVLTVFNAKSVGELSANKEKRTVSGKNTTMKIEWDYKKYNDKSPRVTVYNHKTKEENVAVIPLTSFEIL